MKGKTGGEGEHTLVDTRGGGGREGGIAVERRTRREKEGAEAAVAAERGEGGGEEENLETIGGAEAAAFHVGWHRLPLKSLLLFVSSSKIMIVCPRDLLLPRPSQCGYNVAVVPSRGKPKDSPRGRGNGLGDGLRTD